MKGLIRFTRLVLLFGLVASQAQASFTSLHIFGDGVCTTTNNPYAGQYYYGLRRSNGRVWVEVLAQRLGFGADSITNDNWSNSSNNWSYFGQASSNLVANLNQYNPPPDVQTALYVVWVNDADFVNDMSDANYISQNTNLWTTANNQSLTNDYTIVTNLYAMGVRTLLMPNAVDITEIPQYDSLQNNSPVIRNFIRQQVINFDTGFTATLSNAAAACPGLKIYEPDFFALLDNVLTNSAAYGLSNALYGGVSSDALDDPLLTDKSLNSAGTNFIFWDKFDPTAKVHEIMADTAQQLISQSRISQITRLNGNNLLNLANIPIGLNGVVQVSTNLAQTNWTTLADITSTNSTQSVMAPVSGPVQFYRLKFPFAWTWP